MATLFVPKVDASKRGCVDRLINAITKLDENKSQRKNSRSETTNGRQWVSQGKPVSASNQQDLQESRETGNDQSGIFETISPEETNKQFQTRTKRAKLISFAGNLRLRIFNGGKSVPEHIHTRRKHGV